MQSLKAEGLALLRYSVAK